MSFEPVREYRNAILRPIAAPLNPPSTHCEFATYNLRPSPMSSAWTATTHTFVGTANRAVAACWPPENFNKDPKDIPDGPKYNVLLQSREATYKSTTYQMYDVDNEAHKTTSSDVPPPRITVKRYIPCKAPSASKQSAGMTLLMLPSMGIPKEVSQYQHVVCFMSDHLTNLGLGAHVREHSSPASQTRTSCHRSLVN